MIVIKHPLTRDEYKAYYTLRYRILRQPWGQAKGTEKDDYEPISQHFMAVDDKTGEIVGVAKLFEREPGIAWMSHLAVIQDRQRQGIGKLLVNTVEETARQQGFTKIGALSRLNTTAYFEKFGYSIKDLPAPYFGAVQVVWMEKSL